MTDTSIDTPTVTVRIGPYLWAMIGAWVLGLTVAMGGPVWINPVSRILGLTFLLAAVYSMYEANEDRLTNE